MQVGIKLSILLKQNCDSNYHFNPHISPKLFSYFDKIFSFDFSYQQQTKKKSQLLPVKSMQVFILIIFYVNLCKAKPVFRE